MARWLLPVVVAVIAGVGLALAASGGAPSAVHTISVTGPDSPPPNGPCTGATRPAEYAHVVWILMGAASVDDVQSKDAPSVASYAADCGQAAAYTSVSLPWFPNIPALVAGTTNGLVRNHCGPPGSPNCPKFPTSLFNQLSSWKVYVGGMTAPCSTGENPLYDPRSNPPLWVNVPRAECLRKDVPLGSPGGGALTRDLNSGTLPRFSIVIPDRCHSMTFYHPCLGGQAAQSDFVTLGDTWLSASLKQITHSKAYMSGSTAVIVTWSSGPGRPPRATCLGSRPVANCHVETLVLARSVASGTVSPIRFTHYSLLKTTEELLGVAPLGAARLHATASMKKPFGL